MTFDDVAAAVGRSRADELREKSLAVYSRAAGIARERGVILCDTKFEWGVGPGASDIVLADEVLTPDSSRFWSAAAYAPGKGQESYDKQFVRDYLSGLDWDRTPPGPELPASVVEGTSRRYREIFELITGREWKAE
jgi:phosphoribosylaminoimidazole-succinocarboxamide synthase